VSPLIENLVAKLKLSDAVRPPDDGRRRAAVAILLYDEGPRVIEPNAPASRPQVEAPRVLLMKRIEREGDPWSGHISLPGGGFQASDADMLATAIRETHEELGVDLKGARLLGNLMPLHPFTSGPMGVEVTPFVFATTAAVEPQPGPEAEAAFWLPLDVAASGRIDSTYTYPGTDRTFPCWTFERYTIWGLTWRILSDLLEIAKR
jgi:8-oxo-dGTP pyrophosphatase MutT (NUDIX family)